MILNFFLFPYGFDKLYNIGTKNFNIFANGNILFLSAGVPLYFIGQSPDALEKEKRLIPIKNFIFISSQNNDLFSLPSFAFSDIGYNTGENGEETFLRRAEILFFISIPFIYLYLNNLIKFNNFLIYGDWERDFSAPQKLTLYISFILFGLDIIITDYKANQKGNQ